MTRYLRTALGAMAVLGLALAASVAGAHGGMEQGMGGGMGQGIQGGMHESMGGMHGGKGQVQGHGGGMGAGQQLMTSEERTAMRERMHAAATPEERQALAAANRAEMEKRAKEKGITVPDPSPRMGGQRGHRH